MTDTPTENALAAMSTITPNELRMLLRPRGDRELWTNEQREQHRMARKMMREEDME